MADKKNEGDLTSDQSPAADAPPEKKKRKRKKISKAEAVRRSLADLGPDAKPKDIQADIKKRFRIKMTTDHISTSKGDAIRKGLVGEPTAEKKRPGRKPKSETADAANGKGAAIEVEDIVAVKTLVQKLGAESLRSLIDALTK
jgi:hypothetical protein